MPKFIKRPVVIDAFFLDGGEMPDWFLNARSAGTVRTYAQGTGNPFHDPLTHAEIDTLEGTHRADRGDWIIQGVKGELYPCKPDIFALTYELVDGCALCKGTGVADLPDPWGGVRGTCPDCHGTGNSATAPSQSPKENGNG